MNYKVLPGPRKGRVLIPASKSYAHRQLICAALSEKRATVICDGTSKDIIATTQCLEAMGAAITFNDDEVVVDPIKKKNGKCILDCNESGSTLRFLLPVAAALGISATFVMAEGLAARPVDELLNVMSAHGVQICKGSNSISLEGRMTAGEYSIPGNISSQYISGLLMALPLLEGDSKLTITGNIESRDYIKITEDTLQKSGIFFEQTDREYVIKGNQKYESKENAYVERDWSNAAFFLCMGALSEEGITLEKMVPESHQGDKAILDILVNAGADITINDSEIKVKRKALKGQTVDASAIPDLVPTIAALSSLCEGRTVIKNAERLRIKESDRLKTTSDMLKSLGADIIETGDGLIIEGKPKLKGGAVDACNDHRIAMAAAVAACGCESEVVVIGAECVAKSYPTFWEHLEGLETENEQ